MELFRVSEDLLEVTHSSLAQSMIVSQYIVGSHSQFIADKYASIDVFVDQLFPCGLQQMQ